MHGENGTSVDTGKPRVNIDSISSSQFRTTRKAWFEAAGDDGIGFFADGQARGQISFRVRYRTIDRNER